MPPVRPARLSRIIVSLCACALLLPLTVERAAPRRSAAPPPAAAELERAWRYALALRTAQAFRPDSLVPAELVALGYFERLRLGLGSPFRLIDHALQDPRLPPAMRTRVGAALLHAAGIGQAYEMDPTALTAAGLGPGGRSLSAARDHLALVEATVAGARDPRTGEMAVRAAYRLAVAENVMAPQAATLAAEAAALARDRELARRDVRRLLDESRRTGRHPLALVREWRAARRLQVEAPAGAERPPRVEIHAAEAALPLARQVRAIALRAGDAADGDASESIPFLAPAAAARLASLVRRQSPPPGAPLQITVDRYRAAVLAETPDHGRAAVRRLLDAPAAEERFAAELARVPREARGRQLAVAVLEAAVAMRAYAQEPVWHPGFPAPSTTDLKRGFGLATVHFDPDVPPHWRPYYRRMLGESLADLESVLPGLDLQGLTFRIGRTGREGSALAIHSPGRRTIHLPPGSGPGSIAHEVAHDVDWQVALRRYGRRGAYGTDLALERGGADDFAAAVRLLPLAPVPHQLAAEERRRRDHSRPAEAFARLFDGYVTSMLAARGRSNGYLSSLQDELLTGHGTAVPPDARGVALDIFLPLLAAGSPLTPEREAELRMRWRSRTPGPLALVAEVVGMTDGERHSPRDAGWASLVDRTRLDGDVRARIAEVERRRDDALRARAALACANSLLAPLPEGEPAVRALVHAAAEARIRGILRAWARARRMDVEPEVLRRAWLEEPTAAALTRPAGCGASAEDPGAAD